MSLTGERSDGLDQHLDEDNVHVEHDVTRDSQRVRVRPFARGVDVEPDGSQ